jgi:hypothetical protein
MTWVSPVPNQIENVNSLKLLHTNYFSYYDYKIFSLYSRHFAVWYEISKPTITHLRIRELLVRVHILVNQN